MGVAIKFLVLSVLSISVVTGFAVFRRQSVRWQTLRAIDIREAGVDLPCPNEGFFQHPTNCSRFYRCVDFVGNGQYFSKYMYECPKKLIFIESIETCLRAKCPGKSVPSEDVTSTTTPIPTTLIPSTTTTTPIPTTIQTTTNAYLNLLNEKDKLKDVNETLSNVGSLLEETQDILQNLGDVLADLYIFKLREDYGAKIDTLKQYLTQMKELSENTDNINLDEINLLTVKIKGILVQIKELTKQIKDNKIIISSNLQNSVSSAINQTKDLSEAVEKQKQQTIVKIEAIDEYITMEFETTEVPELSITITETESYTTEEITTENSDVTTAPGQTDIVDITNEPSNADTMAPDFTTVTINTDLNTQESISSTVDPMIFVTNIETTESFETTVILDIASTTIDSTVSDIDAVTESIETTILNDIQTTEAQDYTTEDPHVPTEQTDVTVTFVHKPWEAHKCQEAYTLTPPLTPEYSLRYCRGQLLGDRTRCNVFYQCSDLSTPYICTEGRVFDQNTQSCLIKTTSMCQDKELVLPTYHCGQVKEEFKDNIRRTARTVPLSHSVRAMVDY